MGCSMAGGSAAGPKCGCCQGGAIARVDARTAVSCGALRAAEGRGRRGKGSASTRAARVVGEAGERGVEPGVARGRARRGGACVSFVSKITVTP